MASLFAHFGRVLGVLVRHGRSREDAEGQIRENPLALLHAGGQLVAPGPSPEATVETQQRLSQIVRVLEAVTRQTCGIYLAHRAGRSYEEIARLTGLAHNKIRRHIVRGLLAIMEDRARGER